MSAWILHILEKPEEMQAVEDLQRSIWTDSETDVVPLHMLLACAHNGGLVIGAFLAEETEQNPASQNLESSIPEGAPLIGFVFGFPGLYPTPDGPRLKHHSHMLGVRADYRSRGVGFALKRAQWQMVRHQGLDRITWTYDPLLSHNAFLNVARLGAVCNTYHRDVYGPMRDGINAGLPSDRFLVDWWVNTKRVERRLSSRPRLRLDLAHFLAADARILNPTQIGKDGLPRPVEAVAFVPDERQKDERKFLLVEIPSDFQSIRHSDLSLAADWRLHTRSIFEDLFRKGYLITDFIYLPGTTARSFYVLSHGESTF